MPRMVPRGIRASLSAGRCKLSGRRLKAGSKTGADRLQSPIRTRRLYLIRFMSVTKNPTHSTMFFLFWGSLAFARSPYYYYYYYHYHYY